VKFKIEGRFAPLLEDFTGSPVFQELPPAALKVFAAIGHMWIQHEFSLGRIPMSRSRLVEITGIKNKALIDLSLAQLVAVELLTMDKGTLNGRKANRYRMTWLPGHNGGPATKPYLELTREEAKARLEALKPKRKSRRIRVTVEFEDF
jgi:hypothetical protein